MEGACREVGAESRASSNTEPQESCFRKEWCIILAFTAGSSSMMKTEK